MNISDEKELKQIKSINPMDNHRQPLTVYIMLLKTFTRSKVEITCYLAHIKVAANTTAFIGLFGDLCNPTFFHALRYTLSIVECPAFLSVCFSYIITSVATPTYSTLNTVNTYGCTYVHRYVHNTYILCT